MDTDPVAPHQVLDGLVRGKVHGVRRAWTRCGKSAGAFADRLPSSVGPFSPAPTTTLDMPRHRLRTPSPLAIRYVLWSMPLYTDEGEGFNICMRVWPRGGGLSASEGRRRARRRVDRP